jgi:hypothetical protein
VNRGDSEGPAAAPDPAGDGADGIRHDRASDPCRTAER